jgi:hypothetical protein
LARGTAAALLGLGKRAPRRFAWHGAARFPNLHINDSVFWPLHPIPYCERIREMSRHPPQDAFP